ncbi:MAG: hypothetical protein A2Y79_13115 [Deltaproteobacteria bacterium RBG_13_43_22]|nr:MAG: hypothetical protein A2Y79_13115 [Deltaproteobacteria bacterium RBG_13_43_22]
MISKPCLFVFPHLLDDLFRCLQFEPQQKIKFFIKKKNLLEDDQPLNNNYGNYHAKRELIGKILVFFNMLKLFKKYFSQRGSKRKTANFFYTV